MKRNKEKKKIDTKKLIPIVVASILALILIFGAVLGIIALVRETTSVVSYGGIAVTEGVASYLASTYKHSYLRYLNQNGVDAIDSAAFWASKDQEGRTYGDLLEQSTEDYVRRVTVAAYLFDRYTAISAEARAAIDEGVREVLDYKADGSTKIFNEEVADMGFTYSDFVVAAELLYKAENAIFAIYGTDGSALATDANVSICEDYLAEYYSHVKLLFIRHNDKFVLDENGNRIVEDGRDKLEELSSSERAERMEDISTVIESIENIDTGSDGQMSELYFNSLYGKYNDDPDYAASGYYFSPYSEATLGYAEMYGEAIKGALSMEVGSYAYYDIDEGGDGTVDLTLFVYRTEVEPYAYAYSATAAFFDDFYTDCAEYHFELSVGELIEDVMVKDGYYNINLATLIPNGKFYITE